MDFKHSVFLKAEETMNLRLQVVSVREKLMILQVPSPACGNFWREPPWTAAVPFEVAK